MTDKKMVQITTKEGEVVTVEEGLALTMRAAQDAERAAGKGKGKKGNGRKPANQTHYESRHKDSGKVNDFDTSIGAGVETRTGVAAKDIARTLREQEREARRAANQRLADDMASKVLDEFHDPDLEAEIASLMAQVEQEFTVLERALEVREKFNLATLALKAGRAQFEANFSSELKWVETMRADLRKNSVPANSPLALKLDKVCERLENLENVALEPLRKAVADLTDAHNKALVVINDTSEKYWAAYKAAKGGEAHK